MLANKTFLFVDQSSPDFFRRTPEELLSITFLSDFGYLESFRRYSRSNSKVVKNRAEFWGVRTFNHPTVNHATVKHLDISSRNISSRIANVTVLHVGPYSYIDEIKNMRGAFTCVG